MASSVPRTRRKAYADIEAAKSLKCALFTNLTGYSEDSATNTYTTLAASATEVSASGTGYTTGGYAMTGEAASNVAGGDAMVDADDFSLAAATFTFRYAVIYNSASPYEIIAIHDAGTDKTVTAGTVTISWDATYGFLKFS